MNRLLVGRVLSLGLLVVLVVLALSACGGDEKKAKARPLPEDPKALRPGTYRSEEDRKSTRLNSSHANISYAVFCLKKKKKYLQSLNSPYFSLRLVFGQVRVLDNLKCTKPLTQ